MAGRLSMSAKIDTEVSIGGKTFTLSGYESEEYLQEVASYINHKLEDFHKADAFKKQSSETQNVLIQLNLADDYFQEKKRCAKIEAEMKDKDNELYDLKHELVATQIKLENAEKSLKSLQKEKKHE